MTQMLLAVHEAQRTGAPLGALALLRHLDRAVRTTVVIKRAGPLAGEFADHAGTVVTQPGGGLYPWLARFRFRGVPVGGGHDRTVARRVLARTSPDVVYASTVVTAEFAALAVQAGVPSVLHVHELQPRLGLFLRVAGQHDDLRRATLVATSRTTAQATASALGCDPHDITVAYPPIDGATVRRLAQEGDAAVQASVVGCGHASRVKGADLMPNLAASLRQRLASPPQVIWLGDGPLQGRLERQSRTGTTPLLSLGAVANPYPILAAAQVVVVPSRQEALSRVALEALALGRAVVAFDVGGLPEAIGDAGILVSPGDIDAMAAAVARLLTDDEARTDLGRRGPARVRELFSVERHLAVMAGVLEPLGITFADDSISGRPDGQTR